MSSLTSPSLLSPNTVPVKPIRTSNDKTCFERFRSALAKCTIHPKTPEQERLSGAQWRGHDFVQVTELTQLLVNNRSGQRSMLLEELLKEVYDDEPHKALRIDKILQGRTRCLVTFCILLEIGSPDLLGPFQSAGLFDGSLPMTRASLENRVQGALEHAGRFDLEKAASLTKAFNEKQWKYFPIQLSMVGQRWDGPCVMPFIDRQLITDKGGTSTVYQVAVPETFVADDIKRKVASSMEPYPEFEELGKCCHFALKVFEADNITIWRHEVEVYQQMMDAGNSGMLTYIGDFTLVDGKNTTHVIILEYADSDLSEYFYRTSPVLPEQIYRFWEDLSSIAVTLEKLHDFKVRRFNNEHIYEGWHADIKSDNILLVNGQFKLADPGFAKLQRRKEECDRPRAHQFTGGTSTYGAPERHIHADKVTNPRACDMWSLGCVLSEAATWVVLGPPGVRQFRDLRLNAVKDRCNQRTHSLSLSEKNDVQYDCFHDGEHISSEVKEWHKFLRKVRRPTDKLTEKILDLVDQHLLITNPADRFKARGICDWFLDNLTETKPMIGAPDAMSEAVRKAISVALEREAEELQEHLDSRSKIARDAAKVDPTYLPVPGFTNPSKVSPSRKTVVAEDISPTNLSGQKQMRNDLDASTHDMFEGGRPQFPATTVHALSGQPIAQNRKGKRYCVFHAYYTFMDKKLGNEQDKGDVKSPGIWRRLRSGPQSKDKKLAEYIQNRNLVFLVDNGATMDNFWYEAVFVLETLYNKSRGSDEDGVDLYFTCGGASVKDAIGDPGLKAFQSKVWNTTVKPQPEASTNMQQALNYHLKAWLDEYEQRMDEVRDEQKKRKHKKAQKDLTIIVLTDGIWPTHQKHPTAVDDAIVTFNENFRRAARTNLAPRTVSIQFVSFGNDPAALERLRRLDDNLGERGVLDIVDHEPSTGDVYKMLAGSVSERMDSLDGVQAETSMTTEPPTEMSLMNHLPVRSHPSRASGSDHLRVSESNSSTSQRMLTLSPQQTRDRLPSITRNMYQ